MRRMFSEKQIQKIVKEVVSTDLSDIDLVVKSLSCGDITSTGDLSLTGDASVGGDVEITGDASVGGDAEITGDLVAGTLKQTEPNWEANISIASHTGGDNYIATLTYGKCVLINNQLQVVAIVKCENQSDASITHPHVSFSEISVPSDLGAKIYDLDGKNLGETPLTNNCPITSQTRGAKGSVSEWVSQYNALATNSGKMVRGSTTNTFKIVVHEGLPTLAAAAVGYSIIAFELVII